jgi:RNA polymerase sigma-70 factor (ECF subfamily)
MITQGSSEGEILQACRDNNRQAQEILYRKYAAKMFHICLSYTADRDSAKDILQESFVKIFKGIHTFSGEKSLEGWMRRIVTNTAIDFYRKEKRIRFFQSESSDSIESISTPANQFTAFNTENILHHLKRLPEGARLVFHMFAVEGYSHKEIAGKLSISEGTSKSQFNRARTLLQEWLSLS